MAKEKSKQRERSKESASYLRTEKPLTKEQEGKKAAKELKAIFSTHMSVMHPEVNPNFKSLSDRIQSHGLLDVVKPVIMEKVDVLMQWNERSLDEVVKILGQFRFSQDPDLEKIRVAAAQEIATEMRPFNSNSNLLKPPVEGIKYTIDQGLPKDFIVKGIILGIKEKTKPHIPIEDLTNKDVIGFVSQMMPKLTNGDISKIYNAFTEERKYLGAAELMDFLIPPYEKNRKYAAVQAFNKCIQESDLPDAVKIAKDYDLKIYERIKELLRGL